MRISFVSRALGIAHVLVFLLVSAVAVTPAGAATQVGVTATSVSSPIKVFVATPSDLQVINGSLMFVVEGTPGDLSTRELWRSDGTPAGTTRISTLRLTSEFIKVGARGMFFAVDSNGQQGLWKTDGTAAGTVLVTPKPNGYYSLLTDVNGTLFFIETGDYVGFSLMKSDGTSSGTTTVKDVNDSNWPSQNGTTRLVGVGAKLYFNVGTELWTSDGTTQGTVPLYTAFDYEPGGLTNVDGRLFFNGSDAAHGDEPWVSDGNGTRMIKDTEPGSLGGGFGSAVAVGSAALYLNGGLWRTDGTDAGTFALKTFSGPIGRELVNVNGTSFFQASDNPYELWKSDGTTSGTVRVFDSLSTGVDQPEELANIGGNLVFAAHGPNGNEPYITDGIASGTRLIQDINPGAADSNPAEFTLLGDQLFFVADGPQGVALWSTPLAAVASGTQSTVTPSISGQLTYVTSTNIGVSITIPAGAVTQPTTFVYTSGITAPLPSTPLAVAGGAFHLQAYHGADAVAAFAFGRPMHVTIHYTDSSLAGIDEALLTLRYWDGTNWIDAATTCAPASGYGRDLAANTISLDVCHLTDFAVFGAADQPNQRVFLPLIVR